MPSCDMLGIAYSVLPDSLVTCISRCVTTLLVRIFAVDGRALCYEMAVKEYELYGRRPPQNGCALNCRLWKSTKSMCLTDFVLVTPQRTLEGYDDASP